MVYSEKLADVGDALRREREVKRWSRPKKVAELALKSPPRLTRKPRRGRRRRSASAAGVARGPQPTYLPVIGITVPTTHDFTSPRERFAALVFHTHGDLSR